MKRILFTLVALTLTGCDCYDMGPAAIMMDSKTIERAQATPGGTASLEKDLNPDVVKSAPQPPNKKNLIEET